MRIDCYCRVSTFEQNLDRQAEPTITYFQNELDVILSGLQVYRGRVTGTNTSREGYKHLIGDVEVGEVDTVIAHEVNRLAWSLQDLDRTISRIMESGATIHFVRDGLSFGDGDEQPVYRLQMQMFGTSAEWEVQARRTNT